MTAVTAFGKWWDQLPMDMRLRMNKSDAEFAWLSASNSHTQLERQARHAAKETQDRCVAICIETGASGDHDKWFDCADTIAERIKQL